MSVDVVGDMATSIPDDGDGSSPDASAIRRSNRAFTEVKLFHFRAPRLRRDRAITFVPLVHSSASRLRRIRAQRQAARFARLFGSGNS